MDRRVKYTKKILKETLLNFLEEKDISEISITEICREADINRGTFYRYYDDIYDLLKGIEQEFIDEIKNSDSIEKMQDETIYTFTKNILNIFENNKKLVKILFNTDRNIYFIDEVLEIAYEKCINHWGELSNNKDNKELENAVIFIFNGALGVINYWVKNNFDTSSDELAKYIENCCINGSRKYIPRNK